MSSYFQDLSDEEPLEAVLTFEKRIQDGYSEEVINVNMQRTRANDDCDDDKPPLHVFFDTEAMQDTGKHIPNLLIAEMEDKNSPFHFKGEQHQRFPGMVGYIN